MACAFRVEGLECRRLCSGASVTTKLTRAAAVVDAFTTLTTNGILNIDGNDHDNFIHVKIVPATNMDGVAKPMGVSVLVVDTEVPPDDESTTFVGGKVIAQKTFYSGESPAIKEIYVNGLAGDDVLYVDTATHYITRDRAIEKRNLLATNRAGRVRTITDISTAALPGVFSGKISTWLTRSESDIDSNTNKDPNVLFLGDSMIRYFLDTGKAAYESAFADYNPANLGLAGDTTSQMLYRIREQGLLDGLDPKMVVLEVGTNNVTLTDNPGATFDGIKMVVQAIRQKLPAAKLLLCSILPRPAGFDNRVINKINDRLSEYAAAENGVIFLSTTDKFSGNSSRQKYYRANSLHLNTRGYAVWAQLIQQKVDEILE